MAGDTLDPDEGPPQFHGPTPPPPPAGAARPPGQQPALVVGPADAGAVHRHRPPGVGRGRPRPPPGPGRGVHRAPGRVGRRCRLPGAPHRRRRRPGRVRDPPPLVPAGGGRRADAHRGGRRDGHRRWRGGLLLARVRHRRGGPAVLGRPRGAGRRPPEVGVGPRGAAGGHRALLPPRLLPPVPDRGRLAAGAVPGPRPLRHGAGAVRRRSGSRSTWPARPWSPRSGRPRSGARPCTCSTPTSRRTATTSSWSPTGSTAATSSTGSARRCCSASAASGPSRRSACRCTVFHTNEGHAGFLGLERIRTPHGARRAVLPRGAGGGAGRGGVHHPHPRAGRHRPVPPGADGEVLRRPGPGRAGSPWTT